MRTSNVCPTCAAYINALCVIYNGEFLPTLDITTGDNLEYIIQQIENFSYNVDGLMVPDNINRFKRFRRTLNQENIYTPAEVAARINASAPFTIEHDEIYYFIFARVLLNTEFFRISVNRDYYVLRDIGRGTYGVGGTVLTGSQIHFLNTNVGNAQDISDLDDTQFIDLGDVGTTDITTAFNAHDFTLVPGEDPVQNQEDGYVIIDVIINSTPLQYLFVGDGGNYGVGGVDIAIDDDFILLTDIEQEANTQIIDLGDIGELAVEDGWNAYDFTVIPGENPIQDQSAGYVVVYVTINNEPTSYLFVGPGGTYGVGGALTATNLDFVGYTPVIETPIPVNDVWRNDAGNQPASTYTESIRHNGQVRLDKKLWVGGGSSYGIANQGSNWLYLYGNQGVQIQCVNPNVGNITLTSTGTFTVPFIANQTKYNVRALRNFNDSNVTTNFTAVGVGILDTVDFTSKAGTSQYVALDIKPTIADGTTNQHYAIRSSHGKVSLTTHHIEAPGYTIADIDAIGAKAIPTVEWVNAQTPATPNLQAVLDTGNTSTTGFSILNDATVYANVTNVAGSTGAYLGTPGVAGTYNVNGNDIYINSSGTNNKITLNGNSQEYIEIEARPGARSINFGNSTDGSNLSLQTTLAAAVNRVQTFQDADGIIALLSDTPSEWATYTGTRALGLVVTLGDYDLSSTGTRIEIDADNDWINFFGASGFYFNSPIALTAPSSYISIRDISNSFYGNILNTTLTAERTYTLPDASGTIALTSDLPGVTKYATTIGNGTLTEFTINHALADTDVIVQVYSLHTKLYVDTIVESVDSNNVKVTFLAAPETNEYRVIVKK